MICQQCQAELMETAKFCSECGTEVPEPQPPPICQQCRTELMGNAKFCFQCGTKVLAPQDAIYDSGNRLAELGYHQKAVEDFTEVIRQGPVHADMHYNRGVSKAGLGNHSGAVEDFTEAIRLQPEHLDAFQKQKISQAEMNKPGVSRLVTRIFPRTKPRD